MACVMADSFTWRRSALVSPRVMSNADYNWDRSYR